jgi:hypothetical protein
MVRAILDGRKTQTRRLRNLDYINERPDWWELVGNSAEMDIPFPADRGKRDYPWFSWVQVNNNEHHFIAQCPYGKPGDILWVRETWSPIEFEDGMHYRYKASFDDTNMKPKWKPSIHMPRKACRIFLEVLTVRVERLQDISENDALAEGIDIFTKDEKLWKHGLEGWEWSSMTRYAKEAYTILWEAINGKGSWEKNPWVWVIEFKVL